MLGFPWLCCVKRIDLATVFGREHKLVIKKLLDIVFKTMYGMFWIINVTFMFWKIYGTMYCTFVGFNLKHYLGTVGK